MRETFKYIALGLLVVLLVTAGALVFVATPRPVPPLPFATANFVSTPPPHSLIAPPANASRLTRVEFFFVITLPQKLHGKKSSTWSFAASPRTRCSIQGLLNECAQVNESRYLMPLDIAAGSVQFGNATALAGPQWVAAFENELQKGDVEYWDSPAKVMRSTHLALLRFPEQKTILVLPEAGVADFIRTNGIHLPLPAK